MSASTEADIVERLRDTYPKDSGYAEQANEAADLITKLRAERDAAINESAVLQEVNADLLAAAQLETEKAAAAARDMQERAADLAENYMPSDSVVGAFASSIARNIRALPVSALIATSGKDAT